MRRPSFLLAAVAAAALALAPALADARPGGGGSMGSRGARTSSAPPSTSTAPGQARPMERTAAPEYGRGAASYGQQARPPIGQPNPAGGFFSRSPFMAGLMGGLIGVGLGGLLFGHGLFAGFTGFASFIGLLLQLGLIALVVGLVVGFLRRRNAGGPALAGMPGGNAPGTLPRGPAMLARTGAPDGAPAGRPGGAPSDDLRLQPTDFGAFEGLLKEVNAAWTRGDVAALRRFCTPEMAGYFADDLAGLAAKGLRNETRDVVLESGDLSEGWREGARDYATVAMRFSLVDVTRRVSDGTVVEGDPNRRTGATEIWTFVRPAGGTWQISAVQQTG